MHVLLPCSYYDALEKALKEEFGDDLDISPIADSGTTGNFEVVLEGEVRSL